MFQSILSALNKWNTNASAWSHLVNTIGLCLTLQRKGSTKKKILKIKGDQVLTHPEYNSHPRPHPLMADIGLYQSHTTGSKEKHGKSKENIRGEAEDVF